MSSQRNNDIKLTHYDDSKKKALDSPIVRELTNRRAIKEETIAINRDWVHNQAYRLSHDIHVVSHSLTTFNNLFKFITKTRLFVVLWIICVIYVLCFSCFRVCSLLTCGHLLGKGLTSWLSFVVFNCVSRVAF